MNQQVYNITYGQPVETSGPVGTKVYDITYDEVLTESGTVAGHVVTYDVVFSDQGPEGPEGPEGPMGPQGPMPNLSSPPPIGDVTPNTGDFTVVSASDWVETTFITTPSQQAEITLNDTTGDIAINANSSQGTISLLADNTIGEDIQADKFSLNTSAAATAGVGEMVWNDTDGTVDLGLKGGNSTLQLGQELVLRVKNDDSVQLTDGMVVYVSGANGTNLLVKRAEANAELTSASTIGVVTEPITVNGHGYITTFGVVRGINTNGFNAGDILYLSPSTAGLLTNVKPTAPNHMVMVGFVVKKSAGSGEVFVQVQNGYELDELHNVSISGVSAGQILKRNTGNTTWVNATLVAADSSLGDAVQEFTRNSPYGSTTQLTKDAATPAEALLDFNKLLDAQDLVYSRDYANTPTPLRTIISGKANSVHTHAASDITDSTVAGRALLTAADASAQRTSLGLGTASTADSSDFATSAQGVLANTAVQPNTSPIFAKVTAAPAIAGDIAFTTTGSVIAGSGMTAHSNILVSRPQVAGSGPARIRGIVGDTTQTRRDLVIDTQKTVSPSITYNENQIFLQSANGYVGILTNTPAFALDVNGTVRAIKFIAVPAASAPTAYEGQIYYNSTDKHFYGYNGTTWKQLDN